MTHTQEALSGPSVNFGGQNGDEGKTKVNDAREDQVHYDIVGTYNGGDNAGGNLHISGKHIVVHYLGGPILNPDTKFVIGPGVVVNPQSFAKEVQDIKDGGVKIAPERLRIAHEAQLILPWHPMRDALREATTLRPIGTTLRGIGEAYADRSARTGLRVENLLDSNYEEILMDQLQQQEAIIKGMAGHPHVQEVMDRLKSELKTNPNLVHQKRFYELLGRAVGGQPFDSEDLKRNIDLAREALLPHIATDVVPMVRHAVEKHENILLMGKQGILLDIDYGPYPYVTSSHTGLAGVTTTFGLHRDQFNHVTSILKGLVSRVGEGPFVTEVKDNLASRMRGDGSHSWDEYGATTARPRRVGWFDKVAAEYGMKVGGANQFALTKLDSLAGFDPVLICTEWKDKTTGTIYHRIDTLNNQLPYNATPLYEALEGWDWPKDGAHSWGDVPKNAKRYAQRIQELMDKPLNYVSFGPERTQGEFFPNFK